VWLINEPVKIAYVDGKLLLEVHSPVDGEGQVAQVVYDPRQSKPSPLLLPLWKKLRQPR
jgi:hypothetical protein